MQVQGIKNISRQTVSVKNIYSYWPSTLPAAALVDVTEAEGKAEFWTGLPAFSEGKELVVEGILKGCERDGFLFSIWLPARAAEGF